jgi:hypothetical protein
MTTVENMKKEMTGMVTKTDLAKTTQRLDETHSSVEMVKNELTNVITSIENLKTDTDAGKFNKPRFIFSHCDKTKI